MKDASFERPLVIEPTASSQLKTLLFVSHAVAISVVFIFSQNLTVSLLLLPVVALSLLYYYRWHISNTLKKSVLSVQHHFQSNTQHKWSITPAESSKADLIVELLPSSFVSTGLIILNFKAEDNQRYTCIIFSDAITAEQHRQLRVRIKVLSNREEGNENLE